MHKLKLQKFEMDKRHLRHIFSGTPFNDIIDYKNIKTFYVGSINAEDAKQVDEFADLVRDGNIEKMQKYASIDNNVIYASLVKTKTDNQYLLALISQYQDDLATKCLLGTIVNIEIEEKSEILKNEFPKITLWYIFKEVLKDWIFLRRP